MSKQFENRSFLGLLVLVSLAFLWLLMPFFGPIFWAVAITIIFSPVRNWLHRKMPGRPSISAVLTLLLCLVIVIIPLVVMIASVISQTAQLYQKMESGSVDFTHYLESIEGAFPAMESWLERFGMSVENVRTKIAEGAVAAGRMVAQSSLSVGQNAFAFALDVGVMMYVSFFLLRDGDKITSMLYKALPLGDERERLLFCKFAEVTRATVKGNILVAMVQGTIGGVTFAALGISAALLWGVVMAIASLLPAIGAAVVWIPVAVYLFAVGSYLDAVILTVVGALIISLVDNVLRPILVGRDTKLPDYLVLLSTLGGLVLFGINGFVVGPLIAALFIAFWEIFMREFQEVI